MKYFPPFRFDARTGVLLRAGRPVHLSRKAVELLDCLLASPGTLVRHDEILQSVWSDTHVQPENVKTVIHELRTALGDHPHPPQFIRSDPGRGYRFVADVTVGMPPLFSDDESVEESYLVGREAELRLLSRHLEAAADRCEPQLVVIEGDRGTGKTMLCEVFARQVRRRAGVRISVATGSDVWGTVEPYSVLTDALGLLARQYPHLVPPTLSRRAPGWLARFPDWRETRSNGAAGPEPNQERLVRELIAVLDELTEDVPLLLILEDLQWCDAETVECLGRIARGQLPGRVCIVASFCASERLPSVGQLKRLGRDLVAPRSCSLIRLRPFSDEQMRECLARRFGAGVATAVAPALFDAGGGNPLLAVMTMNSLVRVGALHLAGDGWQLATPFDQVDSVLEVGLADGLQCQLDRLSPEDYRLLEGAATIGAEFTAESVAGALGVVPSAGLSRRLAALAERHLLVKPIGVGGRAADPSVTVFTFRHAVTSDLLLDRLPLKSRLQTAAPAEHRRVTTPRRA
jgi:DNA-binding winged helix-turn-helix (wHTH) protein